jgi:RNA polymerase sigma-70 factor, ECF subfamily
MSSEAAIRLMDMTALECAPMAETVATTEISLDELERYRRELTGYCYRMLGSSFEAEDAVQETIVKAWKNADSYEGRAAVRSWLYRIATNVCLDMLRSKQRRARPMDLGPSSTTATAVLSTNPEHTWIEPMPDSRVLPEDGDPAEVAMQRETIKLAFVAALQHLPARQRAVLILREVLRWQASEVAELLETSVASVNSALQRARATLTTCDISSTGPMTAEQQELVAKYVDAFERYDISSLVSLLHDEAVMSMPPFNLWLEGPEEIAAWHLGPGFECKGSKMLATWANGAPAFGQYRVDPEGGWKPWALQVLEVDGDRIVGLNAFVDPRHFVAFGLPAHLDA